MVDYQIYFTVSDYDTSATIGNAYIIVNNTLTNSTVFGGYTNSSGVAICYIPVGQYAITISKTGYTWILDGEYTQSTRVSVGADTVLNYTLDQYVAPTGDFSVFARNIANGSPIALANVTIFRSDTDPVGMPMYGNTNTSGYVTFSNLLAGEYYVEVSATGFNMNYATHTISSFPDTVTVQLTGSAPVYITETATVKDASTALAIPGAAVVYTNIVSGFTASGTTNSAGVATVSAPAGQYNVVVSASGYTSKTYSGVVVSTIENTSAYTLSASASSTTTLTVTVLVNGTSTPIVGASIYVKTLAGVNVVSPGTSNGSGVAVFSVPYGTYNVEVNKSSYQSNSGQVVCSGASASTTIYLTATVAGQIRFHVTDSLNGANVNNAYVVLYSGTTPAYMDYTASDGYVTFTGFTPGVYNITIWTTGYRNYAEGNLSYGYGIYQRIIVPTVYTVTAVSSVTGEPVVGASVRLYKSGYDSTIIVGDDGVAAFRRAPAGTGFTVTGTATYYTNFSEGSVTVADLGAKTIQLVPNYLQVNVLDYSTWEVVPSAVVTATDQAPPYTETQVTADSSGVAVFTTLTAAHLYTLDVVATGYIPATQTMTMTAGTSVTVYVIDATPDVFSQITVKESGTGALVEGVYVSITSSTDPVTTYVYTTEADGVAYFGGLWHDALPYSLTASKSGYETTSIARVYLAYNTERTIYIRNESPPVVQGYDDWAEVYVSIGGSNISNYVSYATWWREDEFYQSKIEVKLIDPDNDWENLFNFSPGEEMIVKVNGTTMMVGELENIEHELLDGSVYFNTVTLFGVGPEVNLHRMFFTRNYPTDDIVYSDDIIEDVLNEIQDALPDVQHLITYSSPSSAPSTITKFNMSDVADKFKTICQAVNYSGFVDNDYELQFFDRGSRDTNVSLIIDGTTSSNINRMEFRNKSGYDIQNYIEIYGKNILDQWTDNGSYTINGEFREIWTSESNSGLMGGSSPNWEYVKEEYVVRLPLGTCSLKFAPSSIGSLHDDVVFAIAINFPSCNYQTLNLSYNDTAYFYFYGWLGDNQWRYARPRITDIHGNEIEYHRPRSSSFTTYESGPTELDGVDGRWVKIEFPYGEKTEVKPSFGTPLDTEWYTVTPADDIEGGVDYDSSDIDADNGDGHAVITIHGDFPFSDWTPGMEFTLAGSLGSGNNGVWHVRRIDEPDIIVEEALGTDYLAESSTSFTPGFNWRKVAKLAVYVSFHNEIGYSPYAYIDTLSIPTVSPISISSDSTSMGIYGKRMGKEYRPDIMSQKELDERSYNVLINHKDPARILHIIADGQSNSLYAGETLYVTSPLYVLDEEVYRIVKLHHIIAAKNVLKPWLGYNWVTEYEMIRNTYNGSDQHIEHRRVDVLKRSDVVTLDKLIDLTDRITQEGVNTEVDTYENSLLL